MLSFYKYEFQKKKAKIKQSRLPSLQTLENYGQQQTCQKEAL
jgi:hypothetical protein